MVLASFTNLGGIPSDPGAELTLMLLMQKLTSSLSIS